MLQCLRQYLRPVSALSVLALVGGTTVMGCSSDDGPASDTTPPSSANSGSPSAEDQAAADALASYAEDLVAAWVGSPEGTEADALAGVSILDRGARMAVSRQQPGSNRVIRVQACAAADGGALERRFVFRFADKPDHVETADRTVADCPFG